MIVVIDHFPVAEIVPVAETLAVDSITCAASADVGLSLMVRPPAS